jgi:protein-tyrosine phosphatase
MPSGAKCTAPRQRVYPLARAVDSEMRALSEALRNHLARDYGGKRAFVTAMWYAARASVGAFRSYRQIRWHEVSRVVFVCKGNICRSPYAEHRFREWGANVVSAGLFADPGKPAALAAQQAALRRGVNLAAHRSRVISELDIADGDLLVAFEPKHAKALKVVACNRTGVQVTLLAIWSPTPWFVYLHDPYGLSESHFEECFARIDRALNGLLMRVSAVTPKADVQ